MKKTIALLLALITSASLFACGTGEDTTNGTAADSLTVSEDTEAPTQTDEGSEEVTEAETEALTNAETEPEIVEEPKNFMVQRHNFADITDKVKFLGRTYTEGTGVVCDMSASGFEFCGYMKGAVRISITCTEMCYFTVYVDGERTSSRFFISKGTHEITVATFTEFGFHTVRVVKQTEPSLAQCTFNVLQTACIFSEKPENKEIYIEFIGDSIVSGYGNLCDNTAVNAGKPQRQDATQAFPYMTAELLGADCSVISCSGIGLVKGAYKYNAKDFYSARSYYKGAAHYAFDRVPNVVVINLGTNDSALGVSETDFKNGVKALVEYVRASYKKDVPVVWTYNSMNDEAVASWLQAQFTALGGEEAGLYLFKLDRNGDGGDFHPSLDAHKAYSEKLSEFIGNIIK